MLRLLRNLEVLIEALGLLIVVFILGPVMVLLIAALIGGCLSVLR
jgi:hypothetical protein